MERIRSAKSDLENHPNPSRLADEAVDLDWTAFQMVILGGAGDPFSHSNEADDADDLVSWFVDLGLGLPGALLTCVEQDEASRKAHELPALQKARDEERRGQKKSRVRQEMTQVPNARPATPAMLIGERTPPATVTTAGTQPELMQINSLPIPVLQHLGLDGRLFNRQSLGLQSGFAVPRLANASGSAQAAEDRARWYAERGRQESADSLPQSPILDLLVSRGTDGGEYVVPMGSSLGHDLGDFLRWEASHVQSVAEVG